MSMNTTTTTTYEQLIVEKETAWQRYLKRSTEKNLEAYNRALAAVVEWHEESQEESNC